MAMGALVRASTSSPGTGFGALLYALKTRGKAQGRAHVAGWTV